MKRYPDWPTRLTRFIESNLKRPLEWGVHDCALFACSASEVLTGDDPAREVRGTYASAFDAQRTLLRHFNAWNLEGLAMRLLGDPVPTSRAKRGDIAMIHTERGPALGVVIGADAVYPGPTGLVFVPLHSCVKAWPLGW